MAATPIGIAPLIASLIAEAAASRIGCVLNEHGAYTVSNDDTLTEMPERRRGGDLLHGLHMPVLLFFITWPLIPIGS